MFFFQKFDPRIGELNLITFPKTLCTSAIQIQSKLFRQRTLIWSWAAENCPFLMYFSKQICDLRIGDLNLITFSKTLCASAIHIQSILFRLSTLIWSWVENYTFLMCFSKIVLRELGTLIWSLFQKHKRHSHSKQTF